MKKISVYTLLIMTLLLTSCGKKEEEKKEINVDKVLEKAVPQATQNVVEYVEAKKEAQNVTIMDEMKPVFSALGSYIHESKREYKAYSDEFYTTSFRYLLAYSKDRLPKESYKQENGKAVLTKDGMLELSSSAYASREYGFMELSEATPVLSMDDNYEEFYISGEVATNYQAEIKSVEAKISEESEVDKYNAIVELKKDNKVVENLEFVLVKNELLEKKEEVMYNYSVINVIEVR